MASVLLCTDERLGRQVAVKRLHADQPGEVERRLVREAKLGASLNHPNLVAVFDTATDDEGVLIVMEYVEGEPLSRALRHGPLERRQRFGRMAVELGDALDHAHAHGVVHRDVKPSNVLLRRDGVTKLVDLGIATAVGHTRITGSGVVLGTAAYMAPEQLDGRPAESPADVYAFSCVCFEALSGRRARKGRTAIEIAHRIATEPPPDLREALPEASPATAALLARGMARDPAERPASAGELGRELRRELGSAPAAAAPRPTASPRPAAAAAPTAAATPAASPARTASAPAPPARPPLLRRAAPRRPAPCPGPAWPRSCWPWPRSRWGPPCSPECSRRETTGARTARRLIGEPAVTAAGSAPRRTGRMTARSPRRPPSPAAAPGARRRSPRSRTRSSRPRRSPPRKTRRPRNRRPHRRTGRA